MSRERRPGLGGISGGTTGRSGGLGVPGRRTLTQGLVQRKARAAATIDPPPVYEESRATIDLGGGGAAAPVGAGEVGHGGARADRAAATIDAPAAWDESLGRPTISISGDVAGEGDGAGEVAAGERAEPGWVRRARAYHEAHAAAAAAFDRLTWGACVGEDGSLDPRKVARWQAEHGVAPDGRVGEATLDAARAPVGGAGAVGGGDRAATSEPLSIDAPARYDEVDRGTLEVGEAGGAGAGDPVAAAGDPVAAGVGDRAVTSEPVSIDAPARYDEVDRGTLAVGGAVSRPATQASAPVAGAGEDAAMALSPCLAASDTPVDDREPIAPNHVESMHADAEPRALERPTLDLASLIEPAQQSAPVKAAKRAKEQRNKPDRDPGFEQVSRGRLKEGHSPSTVVLPGAVADGLQQAWDDSLVDGKPVEQGGNIVRNYDGSYAVRRGEPGDATTFEASPNDVGWTQTVVGVMHTHRNEEEEPYTFSNPDFTSLLAEGQPLNLLRSEEMTYMVVRTREFDALVAEYEARDQLDELEARIYDCYENVYDRTEGPHVEKLEAAVLVVCREFHLVYYKGQGRELARVSPRPGRSEAR